MDTFESLNDSVGERKYHGITTAVPRHIGTARPIRVTGFDGLGPSSRYVSVLWALAR